MVDAALQFLVKRLGSHGAVSKANVIEAKNHEDAVSSSTSSSHDLATVQDGNEQSDEMDEEDEDEDEDEEDEDEEADEGAVEEFNEDDGMEVEPNLNTDTTDSETVADEQLIERFSHVWPHTAELLSIGRVDDDAEVLEGIRPRTARGIVFTSIIKPEVRN